MLSTVCRSKVERLMTLSTSAVAVCCCSDSRRSSVRARTSSNSRTFSIAITAWSAKVVNQRDLFFGEWLYDSTKQEEREYQSDRGHVRYSAESGHSAGWAAMSALCQ